MIILYNYKPSLPHQLGSAFSLVYTHQREASVPNALLHRWHSYPTFHELSLTGLIQVFNGLFCRVLEINCPPKCTLNVCVHLKTHSQFPPPSLPPIPVTGQRQRQDYERPRHLLPLY